MVPTIYVKIIVKVTTFATMSIYINVHLRYIYIYIIYTVFYLFKIYCKKQYK